MDKTEFLESLGRKFSTDKIDSHDYLKHYAEHLPDTCRSMLEIGVLKGSSALMWDSFYGKDELDLYLLDLYLDPNNVSPRWVRNNGWTPIIGDQSNMQTLSSITQKFNVIIDDGSHRADHMLISFKHLFFNNLMEGGQYYIEDILCNREEFYWGGEVKSFEDTPFTMFTHFKKHGKIRNPYFNEGESEVFESLIKNVEILSNDELILIERK